MFPQFVPVYGHNGSGLCRQILLEKVAKSAFANKADPGAVLLARGHKSGRGRFLADQRLVHVTDRKQTPAECLVINLVQEVALVFIAVGAFAEPRGAACDIGLHVMTCGNEVGAQLRGVVEKGAKLDFPVAQNIRVGCPAATVLRQEVVEHAVPVFRREIGAMEADPQFIRHRLSVSQVLFGGAIFGAVILFPVFHEQAFNLVARFDQHQCRDGGIHAPRHADNNGLILSRFVGHGCGFCSETAESMRGVAGRVNAASSKRLVTMLARL